MAATTGFVGFGSVFRRGDGASPEVFTTVGPCVSIKNFEHTLETVDATHLDSTSKHEEVLPTIYRTGTLSVTLHYDPANAAQANLRTDFLAATLRNFKIVFSNTAASEFLFSGYITKIALGDTTVDGVQTVDVEIKLSGTVTFTV